MLSGHVCEIAIYVFAGSSERRCHPSRQTPDRSTFSFRRHINSICLRHSQDRGIRRLALKRKVEGEVSPASSSMLPEEHKVSHQCRPHKIDHDGCPKCHRLCRARERSTFTVNAPLDETQNGDACRCDSNNHQHNIDSHVVLATVAVSGQFVQVSLPGLLSSGAFGNATLVDGPASDRQ